MKYVFGVLLVIIAGFFIISAQPKKVDSLVSKPTMTSVVLGDGSYCQKTAEMNLIESWEKKCVESGKDKSCQLPKETASGLFLTQQAMMDNCFRTAI